MIVMKVSLFVSFRLFLRSNQVEKKFLVIVVVFSPSEVFTGSHDYQGRD